MKYLPEFMNLLKSIRDDIYWRIKAYAEQVDLAKTAVENIYTNFKNVKVDAVSTVPNKADGSLGDATASFDPIKAEFDFGVPAGLTGPDGKEGHQGVQGHQGLHGDQGPRGTRGEQGVPGNPGNHGPIGPHGAQGVAGPQGTHGIQGVKGDRGDGIDFGNVFNTFADLKNAIPHPDLGEAHLVKFQPDGVTQLGNLYVFDNPIPPHDYAGAGWHNIGHVQGPQGNEGPQGPIGPQGVGVRVMGTDTEAKIKLKQGKSGDLWIESTTGHAWVSDGATGAGQWIDVGPFRGQTGLQGKTGAHGPQGSQGPKGANGQKGPQGIQGIQGVKGDTGAAGQTGAKGDQGAVGPAGPKGSSGTTNWSSIAEIKAGLAREKAIDPQGLKGWWDSIKTAGTDFLKVDGSNAMTADLVIKSDANGPAFRIKKADGTSRAVIQHSTLSGGGGLLVWNSASGAYINVKDSGDINLTPKTGKSVKVSGEIDTASVNVQGENYPGINIISKDKAKSGIVELNPKGDLYIVQRKGTTNGAAIYLNEGGDIQLLPKAGKGVTLNGSTVTNGSHQVNDAIYMKNSRAGGIYFYGDGDDKDYTIKYGIASGGNGEIYHKKSGTNMNFTTTKNKVTIGGKQILTGTLSGTTLTLTI